MSNRRPNQPRTEASGQRLDLVKQTNVMGNFNFSFAQNIVLPKSNNMDNHKGNVSTNTAFSHLNLQRPNSAACWCSSLVMDQIFLVSLP